METVVQDQQQAGTTSKPKDDPKRTVVTATRTGFDTKAEVVWDAGADLTEAAEMFGDELVHEFFIRSANIKLQAVIRQAIEQGKTAEEISRELEGWRPDQERTRSQDPQAQILSAFNKLDDSQVEALIAQLQRRAGLAPATQEEDETAEPSEDSTEQAG